MPDSNTWYPEFNIECPDVLKTCIVNLDILVWITNLYSRPRHSLSVVVLLLLVESGRNLLTLTYESFGFAIYEINVITKHPNQKESRVQWLVKYTVNQHTNTICSSRNTWLSPMQFLSLLTTLLAWCHLMMFKLSNVNVHELCILLRGRIKIISLNAINYL